MRRKARKRGEISGGKERKTVGRIKHTRGMEVKIFKSGNGSGGCRKVWMRN